MSFDYMQGTPTKLRVRSNIFPDELPIKVYIPPSIIEKYESHYSEM